MPKGQPLEAKLLFLRREGHVATTEMVIAFGHGKPLVIRLRPSQIRQLMLDATNAVCAANLSDDMDSMWSTPFHRPELTTKI